MNSEKIIQKVSDPNFFHDAVKFFWTTREKQKNDQKARGTNDQGSRSAVTGGKQMDGFLYAITDILVEFGVPDTDIYNHSKLELPGFFRPEKMWDLIVVKKNNDGNKELVAVLELKSQVGPSFGNNFNNRTEEAMGSAIDIWTAYREGAFLKSPSPWIGYLFLLDDCEKSRKPVHVSEPHFPVFPEYKDSSYLDRYHQFCLKLMRERIYSQTCFITSDQLVQNEQRNYLEPSSELTVNRFLKSMLVKISEFY